MRFLSVFSLLALALLSSPATSRAGEFRHLDDLRRVGLLPSFTPAAPRAQPRVAKAAPELGEARGFWTYDLSVMPPRNVQVAATCRGVGETVAVYVADDEWEHLVDAEGVARIVAAFDEETPAGEGGISARNEALFGASGDIDGNGRLIVFLYRIPSYQGNRFDGFFRYEDLMAHDPACESNPRLYCSNEAEMIHVQVIGAANPYMAGVMAHEHQHLIHFLADPNEESWINEAMSELAMSAAGYEDDGNVGAYAGDRETPLESTDFVSYGAVMLWGSYLYERFGEDFIRTLVATPLPGREGLEAALSVAGHEISYPELFADWAAAVAAALEEGGEDFALVAVPDEEPDGSIALAPGSPWESEGLRVAGSSFQWFRVEGGALPGHGLDLTMEDGGELRVRQFGLDEGLLVVVANPELGEQGGTLRASWRALPEPVDAGTSPDVGGADVSGAETAASPDAGAQASADLPGPSADLGFEAPAASGGGGCSSSQSGAGPWAPWLLLAAVFLVLPRRKEGAR